MSEAKKPVAKKTAAKSAPEKPAEKKPMEKKMEYISNEDFGKIFTVINGSNTSLPCQALLSILAGIVKTSGKEAEDIKMFAKACEGLSAEEIVSKTVLFTCNSVVLNIWKIFGPEIQMRFDEEMKKIKEAKAKAEAAAEEEKPAASA